MRRLHHVLPLLVLGFGLAAHAAGGGGGADLSSGPSTADQLEKVHRAIDAGDWADARRRLATLQREEPRNADVHTMLGYTWRKGPNPNLAKSFEHYERALSLSPRHKGAHEYIGEAYLMDRKPAMAEKHLASLEQICGRNCDEYQELAKAIADYKAQQAKN